MSCEIEEWRPVVGWPKYEVSNHGRVRSYHTGGRKSGGEVPYLLEYAPRTDKYQGFNLFRSGDGIRTDKRQVKVHVLVLEAFVEPRPRGAIGRHLDGNRQNNRLDNLRWGSPRDNWRDSVEHGTFNRAVLTEDDVKAIWSRLVAGESGASIARKFACKTVAVSMIRRGRNWKWLTSTLPGWPIVDQAKDNRRPVRCPAKFATKDREYWRAIPGHPDYMISTFGNVMTSLSRGPSDPEIATWQQISPSPKNNGYVRFTVRNRGKVEDLTIHRAVLEAFAGPCPEGMMACHNDGDKSNNFAGNLRWDTCDGNARDRGKHGTQYRRGK